MKKQLLFAALLAGGGLFAQTIPNPGMETWVNNSESVTAYSVPQSWITSDVIITLLQNAFGDSTYVVHSVAQTSSAHGGASAIQMSVVTSNQGDTLNGFAYSQVSAASFIGTLFGSGQALGYAQAARPATLSGYYKYNRVGDDSSTVGIYMTHWNTTTSMRDTIVSEQIYFTSTMSNWTQFSIPLNYLQGVYPDTALIGFGIESNGSHQLHTGSMLTIDDLAFSGSVPAGVNETNAAVLVPEVYPNPFSESVTIALDNASWEHASLHLYDLSGREVLLRENISGKTITIGHEGLDNGMYFYTITDANGHRASGKISAQ